MSPLEPAFDLYLAHLRVEKGLALNSVEAYGRDLRVYLDALAKMGVTGWDDYARSIEN